MPYTLKTQQISVKDPDSGEYIGVDVLTEQSEEGLIAELQAEGDTQVERINQAAVDVQAAVDAAEAEAQQIISDTQSSLDTLEAQKNTIAETVASMAELGTDTTLTTPGMAADAKATGDEISNVKNAIDAKQNAPQTAGTAGQVLGLDSNLDPVWVNQSGGGGDTSNCAPIIINTASGDIATFADGANNRQIRKIVGTIEPVQSGTGDPAPDNVRPISGWTGANITGAAKNIFGGTALKDALLATNTTATADGNDVTFKAISNMQTSLFSKFKPNTQYTFVMRASRATASNNPNIVFEYTDGTTGACALPADHTEETTVVFTTAANKSVKCFRNEPQVFQDMTIYTDRCGIFEGVATAEEFEPYQAQTLPINWQTEAGTIYSGTVTLNEDGSADVVSAMQIVTIDNSTTLNRGDAGYDTDTATLRYMTVPSTGIPNAGATANYFVRSNMFALYSGAIWNDIPNHAGQFTINSNAQLQIDFDNSVVGITSDMTRQQRDAAIKTWCINNGVYFVIPIAATTTYHIPNIGSLLTYYGQNNVWIDTGAITECDYPADTKLYIDGLTVPDEDMIANANIASGKYFVVNNQLYLSTAAIAAGASIVPGTNCTATNLAEALNALNT